MATDTDDADASRLAVSADKALGAMMHWLLRRPANASDAVTDKTIMAIARKLAQPAGRPHSPAMRLFCTAFLGAWKNLNYDWRTNGEHWLMTKLVSFGPSVVFDVGANVGEWSFLARQSLPTARVHAFEIVESTFAELKTRFSGDDGMVLNNFGLGERTGDITMHLFEASSTLASHVAYPHGAHRDVMRPVKRGDDYLAEAGLEKIDLLKLDVEGAEHLVLRGLEAALTAGRIAVIQFEYGKVNILTHFLLRDFHEMLEVRGYVLGKLFPDYVDFRPYVLEDEDFLGPNYVAVRKERTDIIAALGRINKGNAPDPADGA